MRLKVDAKFKGKLTRVLKNDIRNLVNFHASNRKSGNLHFDRLLFSKAYKDLDEKIQKSYVSESDAKFQEKLTLVFKNDMRNLGNFNVSSGKSENFHFDVVLLLSIAYKVSAKKVKYRRNVSRDTEKRSKLQTLCLKNDMRNLVNFNASIGKSENLHFDGVLL